MTWGYNLSRADGTRICIPVESRRPEDQAMWMERASHGYIVTGRGGKPITRKVFIIFEVARRYAIAHYGRVISRQWWERKTGERIPVPTAQDAL